MVGAGITGLACAAALREAADVTAVDRIPVSGGVHGWEAEETHELADGCGARLLLGETAIRWDGRELLVVGQDGPRRITAAALVIATGTRSLSRAELGITGGRPAGVVAATVACHLAENGLLVGRRPLVAGGGDWAMRAARELLHGGADHVTIVSPGPLLRDPPASDAVRVVQQHGIVALSGSPRVESVVLDSGEEVECDALVLGHGLAPLRNVDGAVWEGERTVYAQPMADPASVEAARSAGIGAAAAVRSLFEQEEHA